MWKAPATRQGLLMYGSESECNSEPMPGRLWQEVQLVEGAGFSLQEALYSVFCRLIERIELCLFFCQVPWS